jgi:hypothetical protein
MPSPQTLERFIAMVESNDHPQACELSYAEHSTMQENQGTPRVGRDAHVASERRVRADSAGRASGSPRRRSSTIRRSGCCAGREGRHCWVSSVSRMMPVAMAAST